jgi:hypothetical protein
MITRIITIITLISLSIAVLSRTIIRALFGIKIVHLLTYSAILFFIWEAILIYGTFERRVPIFGEDQSTKKIYH